MGSSPKHIALYRESDEDLWKQAERAVRREHNADSAAEGEVLGQMAAAYIGYDGPLEESE